MKKILSVLLALLMLFGITACGKNKYAHGSQKVVLKIGNNEVTEEVYRYFLLNTMDQLAGNDTGYFMGDDREEKLAELEKNVLAGLKQYYSVKDFAKKHDINMKSSEAESADSAMEDLRAGYETKEAYNASLEAMYLSEYMAYSMFYYEALYTAIYDTVSNLGTFFSLEASDVLEYAEENFLFCRQFVISGNGSVIDADAKEKAEAIRARLVAGEDPAQVLDSYFEDNAVVGAYYCFAPSEDYAALDEEFIKTMQPGEISEVRTDGYGYNIIIRLEPDTGHLQEYLGSSVLESYCMHQLNLLLAEIQDAYTVEYIDTREPEEYR